MSNAIPLAVLSWLTTQPRWQQDLARRLSKSSGLAPEEVDEVLANVGSSTGEQTLPAIGEDDVPGVGTDSTTTLVSYGRLQGVGLVSPEDQLRFMPGLNVVFGLNASGKSSYTRGLKLLSRTVGNDVEILGNVFGAPDDDQVPSAMVEVTDDQLTTRAQQFKLVRDSRGSLQHLVAFDAECAELMVTTRSELVYIPEPTRLLTRLASVQDALRTHVAERISVLELSRPPMLGIPPSSEVGRALAQLSGSDRDPDLSLLAAWGDDAAGRLADVTGLIAAAASSTALADAAAAEGQVRDADRLVEDLRALATACAAPAAERVRELAVSAASAQEALELARRAGEDLPAHLDHPAWRQLWEAGRSFVAGQQATFPPPAGDRCPFCEQTLTPDAATRLAHFDAHVTGQLSRTAADAADALREQLARMGPELAQACRSPLLSNLMQDEASLAEQITAAVNALDTHLTRTREAPKTAAAADAATLEDAARIVAAVSDWSAARQQHVEALRSSHDAAELAVLQAELDNLAARQNLASRLTEFETWRSALRDIAELRDTHSALATNRITGAIRDLTTRHTASELQDALVGETAALNCQHLPIQLDARAVVGRPSVQLVLDGSREARIREVASDGERRALALAFFFAEIAQSSPSSVVLDDPVSSLDQERREHIADRLLREAEQRQVIVFTHDLPFLLDLLSRAEQAGIGVHAQTLWRVEQQQVGRVSDGLPFGSRNLKGRLGELRQRLERWNLDPQPQTLDEHWHRVQGFYRDLRTTWERAIEERLFKGVVTRFERSVKTLRLKSVEVTAERLEQIERGMTRASYYLHDSPAAAGIPLPDRAAISKDLEELIDFEKSVSAN